jgi:hypothetical protein
VSITPEVSEIKLAFSSDGIATSTGNVTLWFALFEDGEQVLPTLPMIQTNDGPIDLTSGFHVPMEYSAEPAEALQFAKNVTAQLWVYGTPLGGQYERIDCVQSRLRKDDESSGKSNSTSSTDVGASSAHGNLTSDGNGSEGVSHTELGNPTSDGNASDGASGEDSGASVPHVAFSLVM